MKQHLIVRKDNGHIDAFADGPSTFDENVFDIVEVNVSESDVSKLTENTPAFFRDGTLSFQETPEQKKLIKVQTLKNDLLAAKNVEDMKAVVQQLLDTP